MCRRVSVGTIALLLTLSGAVLASDTDDVRAAFETYKLSALSGSGRKAVDMLSEASVAYYGEMRDLALYATREELKQRPALDMMQALMLRDQIESEQLRGMSGRDILVLAIDNGWVGKQGVSKLDIDEIDVNGDKATARVLSMRGPTDQVMQFVREGGWKFDLRALMDRSASIVEEMLRSQGDIEENVVSLMSMTSGREVSPTIWDPPLERPAAR